jgi:hypothetical protein
MSSQPNIDVFNQVPADRQQIPLASERVMDRVGADHYTEYENARSQFFRKLYPINCHRAFSENRIHRESATRMSIEQVRPF